MKKNILSLTIAAVMVLTFASCGSSKSDGVQLVTDESAAAKTEPDSSQSYDIPEFNMDPAIAETVIVDENNVKITAVSLEYNRYSAKLNLTIENNTDKNLNFVSGSLGYDCGSINGYMIGGMYLNADVAAGKKANETVNISTKELLLYGIEEIADIEIGFNINDDEHNNYLKTGPRQIKTSAADKYDYNSDTFAKAMKDKNLIGAAGGTVDYFFNDVHDFKSGVSIVNELLFTNKDGDKILMFEMVNNSSKDYVIRTSDIFMNGLLVEGSTWTSDTIIAGKRCVASMSLSSLTDDIDAAAFGLTTISDMSFSVETYNTDYEEMYAPDKVDVKFSDKKHTYDASGEELYNENGIRIISKGLMDDKSSYSNDIHIMLLAENKSGEAIKLSTVWDSLSMNGYMADFFSFHAALSPDEAAIINITAMDHSLEKNNISRADMVTDMEISFKIENSSGKTISEPTLKAQY